MEWLKEHRSNPVYWKLAVFMLSAGAKVSEACGLKWEEIDLEQGAARVIRRVRWDHFIRRPFLECATCFKTTQDWHNFIKRPNIPFNPFTLREKCYKDIEQLRNRPLLVYVTKFLEGVPPNEPKFPNFIDLPDVDGFTDLINSVKNNDAVDVLLHRPL